MWDIQWMIKNLEKVNSFTLLGSFIYPTGDKYEGDWENDKKNGKGNIYHNSQVSSVMQMVRNMMEIGMTGRWMDLVFTHIQTVINMMVIGKMEGWKEKVT